MKKFTLIFPFLAFLIFIGYSGAVNGENINPSGVLKKVDEVRCPDEDFSVVVFVNSYKINKPAQSAVYEIKMSGREKAIVRTLQPANERGRVILMRDNDYWFFFPEVSNPLRISANERFLGDVANGDIARINFFDDYNAKFLREESGNHKKYYVMELAAKDQKITYPKVILWVEQIKFWPLKAEFYAPNGRLLKTCSYENYKLLAGRYRPSRLVMKDALNEGQFSVIEYNKIEEGKIEDKYFSRDYLKKMVY